VWHLTHRCHDRAFLLKFIRDRRRWHHWLFEARKRYGVSVLNYVATSNHIHLLVYAEGDRMTIPRSMQLIAGCVAQEFNDRKGRHGAFWEDRYHATAVQTGNHLRRCMTYIDLNMVRAGIVTRPQEWECCGYREIQDPPTRYRRIDLELTARLLELPGSGELRNWQHACVQEELMGRSMLQRQPEWTESIAVGDEPYLQNLKAKLGLAARFRTIVPFGDDAWVLREDAGAYTTGTVGENRDASDRNLVSWQSSHW
jgi:putative transposase